MIIIWTAPLAYILKKNLKKPFKTQKIPFNFEEYVKRIGVYYMCIDDLPL